MSNAGWWPDPLGRNEMRYHDGVNWTDHVSNRGTVSSDPLASAAAPTPQPAPEPPTSYQAPTQPESTYLDPTQPEPTRPAGSPFAPPTEGYPTQPVGGTSPFGTPPTASKDMPFGFNADDPSPLIQDAGAPKRLKWLVLVVVAVVAAVVIALVVSLRSDDDDGDAAGDVPTGADSADAPAATELPPGSAAIAPPATSPPVATELAGTAVTATAADATEAPVPTTQPSPPADTDPPGTAPPDGEIPDGTDGPVPVGVTVRGDGTLVRVNRIVTDAPPAELFEPDPGNTITAVEVEACAGPDGFAANAFYWSAFLSDNTTAENYLFADDFPSVRLTPGGCVLGVITYEVPDGLPVTSVVLANDIFEEIGRWTVDGAVTPAAPLVPETEPASVPIGETVTFGPGHTATLRTVTDAAEPLEDIFPPQPGRQYNRIDVEVCAGSEPLNVNGLSWSGVATDHSMGTSALVGDTLQPIEVAAGQCVAGLVELDMREGSATAYVLYTGPLADELARWRIG
jgi:hypothetical protein